MKPRWTHMMAWMLFLALCLVPFTLNAADTEDDGRDKQYGEMVKEADTILFGQVTKIQHSALDIAVAKIIKGKLKADNIRVSGMDQLKFGPIRQLNQNFKEGQDVLFFLASNILPNVPYMVQKESLVLTVNKGKIQTSILCPTIADYKHDIPLETMLNYLEALVAVQKGEKPKAAFVGELIERLERDSKSGGDFDTPAYFEMLMDISPDYDNLDVLLDLTNSKDVSVRFMAVKYLQAIGETMIPDDADAAKMAKRAAKRDPKDALDRIVIRFMTMLRDENSRLMLSAAAQAMPGLLALEALPLLGEYMRTIQDKSPEQVEAQPKVRLESPRRASVRAIVEFESEVALDMLERELLRNDVTTFRMILDVLKDYDDLSLNLLLLDLMQNADFLPRQVAILEYFRSIKSAGVIKNLKDIYKSPKANEYIRKSITEIIEDYQNLELTEDFLLENGMRDPSPVVRQATARALGALRSPKMVTWVQENYFKEANRLARQFYVDALAQIQNAEAKAVLQRLLEKETDTRMREQIKFALKKLQYL